jgi:hypothetical protein
MRDVTANWTLRNSLRPATAEHEQAADLLSAAADAFLDGSTELASQHLRSADFPVLFRFGRLLMDRRDPEVAWPRRLRSVPKPAVTRVKERMPSAAEILELYIRDGWRCRYCGCRVIYGRACDVLRKAFPDEVHWPASGQSHGGFLALTATPDHVVPHARGGDNSPGNLVTTCWPCNFGMEHDSLDELGLSDPRLRPPVVDGWDGLTRLIPRKPSAASAPSELRPEQAARKPTRAKSNLTPEMHFTQSSWFSSLDASQRPQAERFVELLDSCRDLGGDLVGERGACGPDDSGRPEGAVLRSRARFSRAGSMVDEYVEGASAAICGIARPGHPGRHPSRDAQVVECPCAAGEDRITQIALGKQGGCPGCP